MASGPLACSGVALLLVACGCAGADQFAKFTYNSLAGLMEDIKYNELRREEIITKNPEDEKARAAILTIKNVRVQSVGRNPRWNGVVVVTYEVVKGSLLLGVVYVDMVPAAKMTNLHHDDRVTIIGSAYSYEPQIESQAVGVVRLYGVIV